MTTPTPIIPFAPTSEIVSCSWSQREGKYDLLHPNRVDLSVTITVVLEDGERVFLSQTWPLDNEPGLSSNDYPDAVIDALAARLESWAYASNRDEKRGKIAWMRENITKINLVWARNKLAEANKRADAANRSVARWKADVEALEQEIL